jgi:hypothetical protein
MLFVVCRAIAQDTGQLDAVGVPRAASGGFMTVVLSGGILGLLNWAGIFLWGMLAIPLGIVSIVHCANCRLRQLPITTKLLAVGAVWLFVLGWVGVAQGTVFAFSGLATGAPDVSILALSISQSVYSIAGALCVCQFYLFFLLISIVVVHFKHRKMIKDPQHAPGHVR